MIEIKITTEHFRKSSGYESIDECPLALACEDHFPEATRISVGGFTVHIDRECYNIDNHWGNSNGSLKCDDINEMIQDAQDGIEIPTVTVVLTEC